MCGYVGTDQLWQYWASIVESDVEFLLGVLWVPMLRYSNMVVLVSLVSKNDNLIPDLTLTFIILRCFAAAGFLPLSRTAYQGAYI